MGNHEILDLGSKEYQVQSCADVLVAVSGRTAQATPWLGASEGLPGLVVHTGELGEPVPEALARAASLVLLEVDPASRASMQRLTGLKRAFPDLPVVAAIADTSVSLVRTLVREGVADVVALPLVFEEVLEAAATALAAATRQARGAAVLAPMVAVVRSNGGCGATSVATHLAARLAETNPGARKVAIVDLDIQFGSVAGYLGCEGRGSINDLMAAEARLDEQLVAAVARRAADRLDVFAAPDEVLPLESVDAVGLLRVLELLRRQYDFVVLDLPANWTNWTLSVAAACERIVMVAELSIASLRQAKRRLDLFDTVDIAPQRIEIVANRVERKLFRALDLSDVEGTLGRSVLGSLTLEDDTVGAAQDQGVLAQQLNRRSRFAADVARLAEQLAPRLVARDAG